VGQLTFAELTQLFLARLGSAAVGLLVVDGTPPLIAHGELGRQDNYAVDSERLPTTCVPSDRLALTFQPAGESFHIYEAAITDAGEFENADAIWVRQGQTMLIVLFL
jgi:hypothetical protein